MKEEHQAQCEELRTALLRLFQDAGYEHKGLIQGIESLGKEPYYIEKLEQLELENQRLKEQIRRLRKAAGSKDGGMSSKLREALRE